MAVYYDPSSGSQVTGVTSNSGKSKSSAYTNAGATPSVYKKVYQQYGVIPKDTSAPKAVNTGGGGGGSSTPSGPSWQDILSQIMEYARQQKTALDAQAKSYYDQANANALSQYNADTGLANKNYMLQMRRMKDMYGNSPGGTGLTNMSRVGQNWLSDVARARLGRTNAEATNLQNYNTQLANNASQYQQAWLNSVLPTYANRQTLLDNLSAKYSV